MRETKQKENTPYINYMKRRCKGERRDTNHTGRSLPKYNRKVGGGGR